MQIKNFSKPAPEFDTTTPLRPQSGIDKIKLLLNTSAITPKFIDAVRINNPYTLFPRDNRICLEKRGESYLLILNQEFFDFSQNILSQINTIILYLVHREYLLQTVYSQQNNGLAYIVHVTEVEFYFDDERKNLWVIHNHAFDKIEKARKNDGFFFPTDENGKPTHTYYSCDYMPATDNKNGVKSTICIYDKEQRDIATIVNQKGITREQILEKIHNHKWKMRMEFRLSRDNCHYLHPQNLNGTYLQVLNRYLELLALLYNRFCWGKIYIEKNKNTKLKKVVEQADKMKFVSRFTNKSGNLLKG